MHVVHMYFTQPALRILLVGLSEVLSGDEYVGVYLELVEQCGSSHTHGQQSAPKLAQQGHSTEDEEAQADRVHEQSLWLLVSSICSLRWVRFGITTGISPQGVVSRIIMVMFGLVLRKTHFQHLDEYVEAHS